MAEQTVEPRYTARELLREIQRRGGRVYRSMHTTVFCLTNDPEVAQWLLDLGGKAYRPQGFAAGPDGGYQRAPGLREWDIYVHTIPVKGDETVHHAAGRNRRVELKAVE